MIRRTFIRTAGTLLAGVTFSGLGSCSVRGVPGVVHTVAGPLDASLLGFTLEHEHVLVDFVGADKVSPDRYDRDEVYRIMLPYLEAVVKQGVKTFVDCTPDYLGRDVILLKRLSESTGLQIVTNTGLYKEPYLPAYAFEETSAQLADRWIAEFNDGIGNTGIKPGFIKIAVFPEPLKPMQQKIVEAAVYTSQATGLTIACHTAHGPAALEILGIMNREKLPASQYIFVHANVEKDTDYLIEVAQAGAWVSLDGIGWGDDDRILGQIGVLLNQGLVDRMLLSQDRGWYHVGEEGGGDIKPFTHLIDEFIPRLREKGVGQEMLDQIFVENPARALAVV